LANQIIPERPNGFTYDAVLDDFPEFEPMIHIVSLDKHEQVFTRSIRYEQIYSWLSESFNLLVRANYFVGWSVEKDFKCLDVSLPIDGLENAMEFARQQKQRWIWHPFTREAIPVPSDEYVQPVDDQLENIS